MSKVYINGKAPLTLNVNSTLQKEVYFNPGLFDEEEAVDQMDAMMPPSYKNVRKDLNQIYAQKSSLREREETLHNTDNE